MNWKSESIESLLDSSDAKPKMRFPTEALPPNVACIMLVVKKSRDIQSPF